jgi:hypothetical protein
MAFSAAGKNVNHAVNRLGCRGRVQGAEDQVTRLCRRERQPDGL